MRRSWPFAFAVVIVGGLAGMAIAGRPHAADTFVLDRNITVPLTPVSTTVSTTVASDPSVDATTTSAPPPSSTSST
ncbi:MAG TPA: hypothetical protein VGC84_08400, partial [Ilumatobacteraceae bacterium]